MSVVDVAVGKTDVSVGRKVRRVSLYLRYRITDIVSRPIRVVVIDPPLTCMSSNFF